MSRSLFFVRIFFALFAGGVAASLLVPALIMNGWSFLNTSRYLLYTAAASMVTVPTALIAGSLAYPFLRLIPPGLRIFFFAYSGVLVAGALCLATSAAESIVQFVIVGAASAIISFLLLPRSNPAFKSEALKRAP